MITTSIVEQLRAVEVEDIKMTAQKTSTRARKSVLTRAEYDLRVEEVAIVAGSRFGRGNVALKAGYMYTPAKFEREREAVLTKAGIKFKKN